MAKYRPYEVLLIFIGAPNRKEWNGVSTSYPWTRGMIPATTTPAQYLLFYSGKDKQDAKLPVMLKFREQQHHCDSLLSVRIVS